MAFEIELEDGTILELEDGEDPDAAEKEYFRQQRVEELKAKNPKEYDPESQEFQRANAPVEYIDAPVHRRGPTLTPEGKLWTGEGPKKEHAKTISMAEPSMENFRAGVGSGMLRGWKGLTNLALPDSLTPEWASDENIQEMDKRDVHLPLSGKIIGGAAGTAPLSGATGALLSTASKAAPAASVLARTLASPWSRTAIEGATQGAIFADPDEQGQGALIGAGLGTTLSALGKGGGRLLRGLIEKSEAAKALEQLAAQHGDEIFLPISQAADEKGIISRLGKTFYKEALPIVPGVKGKLTRQGAEAADKLREIALKEALPDGGQLPAEAGKKVSQAVSAIQKQFDDAYDQTIKSYAFTVPKDLTKQVAGKVRAVTDPKTVVNSQTLNKVTSEVEGLMKQFSNGKPDIDGQNLLNVKRELSDLIKLAKNHEKPVYKAADQWIDDHIVAEMKAGGIKTNLNDLKRYLDLTPAYRAFAPVQAAAKQAADKEGRFLFRTLARTAKNSPEQRVIGQIGAETVDKSAAAGGLTGKILAGLGMGGAGFGALMSPGATITALGVGNALATKPVQRALLGDTKLQRRIIELLRNNPNAARRVGSAARAAAVQSTVGE